MYTTICLLLCLLPVFVQGQISIKIQASGTSQASVEATGHYETIINTNLKELFHITDQLLKNAVYNLSGVDGAVYLKEPNPANDVYGNYKIQPVGMALQPNGTKVNVKTEEVILNKLQAFNDDDFAKSQDITLTGSIEDNVTCVWRQKEVFPITVAYDFQIYGLGKGPNWIMNSTFGRNLHKTQTVPVTDASFTVNLGPKSDATAILSATKVTVTTVINYSVILTGHVLTKFEKSYIWGYENYDIKDVMTSAAMPHVQILNEEIVIEFYTDCAIKVYGENYNASNGVNSCLFTMLNDPKNERKNVIFSSAQRKSLTNMSEVKSLQGNKALGNDRTSILLLVCLFILIKIL